MKKVSNDINAAYRNTALKDICAVDIPAFHDVVYDVLCKLNPDKKVSKLPDDFLMAVFGILPEHIRFTAYQWGMGDTVFRDEAYVYLLEHIQEHQVEGA